ncbi:MAG TPA: hypothetical protein VFG47_20680 [Geminicoccaceae bacterium]|nr:hypothetical protein [Geminicoccaceae bacterium]
MGAGAAPRRRRGGGAELIEGRLVITPVPSPAYSLAELVAGITPENRHEETDWSKPVSGEVW